MAKKDQQDKEWKMNNGKKKGIFILAIYVDIVSSPLQYVKIKYYKNSKIAIFIMIVASHWLFQMSTDWSLGKHYGHMLGFSV